MSEAFLSVEYIMKQLRFTDGQKQQVLELLSEENEKV